MAGRRLANSDAVLTGLPSEGLSLLAENLAVRSIEMPGIRDVYDYPTREAGNFSPERLTRGLSECFQGGKQTTYLVVYSSPSAFLMRHASSLAEAASTPKDLASFATDLLDLWRRFHRALLEQYRRHEGRALLLNGDREIEIEALLSTMEARFGPQRVPKRKVSAFCPDAVEGSQRENYFRIVDSLAPECLELYSELESCAELMGREPELEFGGPSQWQAQSLELLQLLVQQQRIEQALRRYSINPADLGLWLDALHQDLNNLTDAAGRHSSELSTLQADICSLQERCANLEGQVSANSAEKRSLQGENELLLLQLHQLQEEVENQSLSSHKNNELLAKTQAENARLVAERDADTTRIANERNQALQLSKQLNEKGSASEAKIKELQSENELLLLQLHQVQEELEHYYLLRQKDEQLLGGVQKRTDSGPALSEQRPSGNAGEAKRSVAGVAAFPLRAAGAFLFRTFGMQKQALKKQVQVLRQSGTFDEQWYLRQYPDVAQAGFDPIVHYLKFGSSEGRNPSAHFDTCWYLDSNPDVAEAGMNPLLHYVKFGKGEGRQPMRLKA